MLDKVRDILELNDILFDGQKDVIYCKFRSAGSNVKITYDTSSNSYRASGNEFIQTITAAFSFAFAFAVPHIVVGVEWNWVISALSIFTGTTAITQLIFTQFKLLDLKQQLRQSGIYLS
ncbi:hypothetical protein BCU70_12875 [Vibrio sp. 10N.286.49.C2]|uniref:hypothetical protein n=1 Tax=unclassified Vibrio TaxID=2614977 RepID=UPI000C866B84|nr:MULTISPECIES: hypothetical protein [unclassified Vibrio]PMH39277.1 hypothetical protein BCU70_12875 [Vibrio sp. 10N.286.49.C2]PMH54375.1 hypothetical protein BCU66_12090 [Vibrio sp. 10N.286.49.B1]PMH78454.1 hypothetical protein BCU58_00790 [Vibrio sp. 10N.286.48.B7]